MEKVLDYGFTILIIGVGAFAVLVAMEFIRRWLVARRVAAYKEFR